MLLASKGYKTCQFSLKDNDSREEEQNLKLY